MTCTQEVSSSVGQSEKNHKECQEVLTRREDAKIKVG
jgi:hypothetical protein